MNWKAHEETSSIILDLKFLLSLALTLSINELLVLGRPGRRSNSRLPELRCNHIILVYKPKLISAS